MATLPVYRSEIQKSSFTYSANQEQRTNNQERGPRHPLFKFQPSRFKFFFHPLPVFR